MDSDRKPLLQSTISLLGQVFLANIWLWFLTADEAVSRFPGVWWWLGFLAASAALLACAAYAIFVNLRTLRKDGHAVWNKEDMWALVAVVLTIVIVAAVVWLAAAAYHSGSNAREIAYGLMVKLMLSPKSQLAWSLLVIFGVASICAYLAACRYSSMVENLANSKLADTLDEFYAEGDKKIRAYVRGELSYEQAKADHKSWSIQVHAILRAQQVDFWSRFNSSVTDYPVQAPVDDRFNPEIGNSHQAREQRREEADFYKRWRPRIDVLQRFSEELRQ